MNRSINDRFREQPQQVASAPPTAPSHTSCQQGQHDSNAGGPGPIAAMVSEVAWQIHALPVALACLLLAAGSLSWAAFTVGCGTDLLHASMAGVDSLLKLTSMGQVLSIATAMAFVK